MQSRQSLHCSRTCAKRAYIRHILSVNTQTRLSIHAVLPEPSPLSHIRKMGVHTAYFTSHCSDAPEHSYRLARAFTALAHSTLNGRSYGIFFQPMHRHALACVQSCQNLSAKTQTRLLSHMRKMGVQCSTAYSLLFSQYSDETKYSCSLARAFTALTHAQNGRTYGIFHQSML